MGISITTASLLIAHVNLLQFVSSKNIDSDKLFLQNIGYTEKRAPYDANEDNTVHASEKIGSLDEFPRLSVGFSRVINSLLTYLLTYLLKRQELES